MTVDGRRARGDQSRQRILAAGVQLAAARGILGFSLAELAATTGTSKAGIAGLFGSKDALTTALIDTARSTIHARVFEPVSRAPRGLARLRVLGDTWIDYLDDPDLRGGCFFAANFFQVDSLEGPHRELFRNELLEWTATLHAILEDGHLLGEIIKPRPGGAETFTFLAIGITANTAIQLGVDGAAGRARQAWHQHLDHLELHDKPDRSHPSDSDDSDTPTSGASV